MLNLIRLYLCTSESGMGVVLFVGVRKTLQTDTSFPAPPIHLDGIYDRMGTVIANVGGAIIGMSLIISLTIISILKNLDKIN